MAANSIAKLAVVITGDTAPLNQSLGEATHTVKSFAQHAEHAGHGGALGSLAQGIKIAYQGTHAFEGSMRGIIHTLHNVGGPAGAAIVAGAAFAFLAYEALKAADKAAEARNKIREEYDKAFEAVNGKKSGVKDEETIGGAWKEAKEAVEDFMATLAENTGLFEGVVSLFKTMAEQAKAMAEYFKTDEQKARDKQMEQLKKQTEQLKEQKKAQEEQQKKAEEAEKAIQRQLEETRRHAERLTASLRTPDEIYRDTIVELKNLAAQGMITGETLARGMAKAQEELDNAANSAKKMRDVAQQRVGAAERYTSAGFSAVQSARAAQEKAIADDGRKTAKNTDTMVGLLKSLDEKAGRSDGGNIFFMSNI